MKLKKELKALDVFSIASGAMISSGLFILPAIAYKTAGSGILLSYLLAGLVMLPALFSQLELATAIPKAGGTYFFIERILGTKAGVVAGFSNWFSISLKSALALMGIGIFAILVFPEITEIQVKMIALAACVIFMIFNLISVGSSSKTEIVMVMFLLTILLLFVMFGWREISFTLVGERFGKMFVLPEGQVAIGKSALWKQIGNIVTATGVVFISYGGLTNVASIAEEVKNPQKNLAKGTISAFVIVQIMYLLVISLVILILPGKELVGTLTPISNTAALFKPIATVGKAGMIITTLAAMLAFITTANAGIMSASRSPMAMARDGLIPDAIGKISKKRHTPSFSIIITSMFIIFIIIALDIEKLAKVASLFMLLLFMLLNVSVIVIRMSKIDNYKPAFKSPLFPFVQIFGILVYLILIFKMGLFTISVAAGFILLSLLWYTFYAKKRANRKSAFIHMVEQVTAPELKENETEDELASELLDILIESNEIIEDRFDKIIRSAPVIDMDAPCSREDAFKAIAEKVGNKWGFDPKSVELKLQYREEQDSTLIYPGVAVPHAIPHIIVEGTHKFDIVLVRNKHGIKWNEKGEIVYTIFSLIGTRDERNFHLRALMAIAQILQDPNFHEEWMSARNETELRSAILLRKRSRK